MFVPFLIMLREGLEAALIVSLIASYLKRTQRGNWIGSRAVQSRGDMEGLPTRDELNHYNALPAPLETQLPA